MTLSLETKAACPKQSAAGAAIEVGGQFDPYSTRSLEGPLAGFFLATPGSGPLAADRVQNRVRYARAVMDSRLPSLRKRSFPYPRETDWD